MNPTFNSVPAQVRFAWIGESWRLFCAQWPTWVATTFISTAISFGIAAAVAYPLGMINEWKFTLTHLHDLAALSSPSAPHSDPLGQILYNATTYVVSAFLYGGLFKMSNRQVRGEKMGVGDLFSGGSTFLPMLGYVIILGLLSGIGMLCFCVGMLVVYALLWPGLALVADGASFSEALTCSFEGMKQDWFSASLYVLVFSLIILVSFIPLGLGLFITTPMIYLSTSLAYRDMIGMSGKSGGSGGYYPTQDQPGVWPPSPANPPDAAPPTQGP